MKLLIGSNKFSLGLSPLCHPLEIQNSQCVCLCVCAHACTVKGGAGRIGSGGVLQWTRYTDLDIKVFCFSRLSRCLHFNITRGLHPYSCTLRKQLNKNIKENQQHFKRFHFFLMPVSICWGPGGGLRLYRDSGNTYSSGRPATSIQAFRAVRV